ncbi:hypothetical protein DL98DRAFT_657077 [Cadophora sp. DSE1049]|nr:hypothetical protein DL98DRAFT_657077 [Cadophora sp. DSE1049]
MKDIFLTAILCFCQAAASATARDRSTGSGSFQSPSVDLRPKFRYWLPDASIGANAMAADVNSIASIHAGGIEFLPYYNYGGQFGSQVTDWAIYGYGTPAYNQVLKAALQATEANGLVMDLALGPQSGQGVPASYDNPGLAYDMFYNYTIVSAGGSFSGNAPGYGLGNLISVTTAAVLNKSVIQVPDQDLSAVFLGLGPVNRTIITISQSTLRLVPVKSDGTIHVEFPSDGKQHIIFGAYYGLNHIRSCSAATSSPNPQNIIANGSFAVDHFSPEGAKVTTDFLEKYVFVDGVRDLFRKVGKYMWEDSLEISSTIFWTPKLQDTFKSVNGYDIDKYVMLLTCNNGLSFGVNYPLQIVTDAGDKGQGYVEDYRSALTVSMQSYYKAITDWSKSYLGVEFSAQVGYNIPVDMSQIIPQQSVPEDESLGFDPDSANTLDLYRQYVGPANLAGKKVISNELGAVMAKCYQMTLPMLTNLVKRAWAVGNNQMVFHAASYSGQYPNTTWPGLAGFIYLFSDPWSRHQPVWDNGFAEMNDFISRTQWVLQAGAPKRDIAFWYKHTKSLVLEDTATSNNFTDLVAAGYGYEFLSPSNFDLPLAKVKNKILAPDGPAYKAFVLRGTDQLTLAGTQKLVQFAKQGLPVVIQGGIPTTIASSTGLKQAQTNIKSILSLDNVRQIGPGPLVPTLVALGVQPRASTNVDGGKWLTYWRRDDGSNTDYVLVYNDGNTTGTGTVTFETQSNSKPFSLDAWTGTEEPIAEYTTSSNSITITFTLFAGQNSLIAFRKASYAPSPANNVLSTSSVTNLGYVYIKSSGLSIRVPASTTPGSVKLSNSKTVSIPPQKIPATITLGNYTLTVERWTPGASLYDSNTVGTKTNKTVNLPTLASWPTIPGLENSAGIGYYRTSFSWKKSAGASGALIDFGAVQNTLRVRINGKEIPPLDPSHAIADISTYLIDGANVVDAIVATTLYNGVVPIYPDLMSSGSPSPLVRLGIPVVSSIETGLLGSVVVTPFKLVKLSN